MTRSSVIPLPQASRLRAAHDPEVTIIMLDADRPARRTAQDRGEVAIGLVSWAMNPGIKYHVNPDISVFISHGITFGVEPEVSLYVKHEVVCEVETSITYDIAPVISGAIIASIEYGVTTYIAPEFMVEVAQGITQGMPPYTGMSVTRHLALYASIGETAVAVAIPTRIGIPHAS